jgi:hypothetical protein
MHHVFGKGKNTNSCLPDTDPTNTHPTPYTPDRPTANRVSSVTSVSPQGNNTDHSIVAPPTKLD